MDVVSIKRYFTAQDGNRVYDWESISVYEALKLAEPKLRCPECYGAVRLHRAAEDGSSPMHAEHRKRNRGCSVGDCFDGTMKMADIQVQ
jgi:hypothetical protein